MAFVSCSLQAQEDDADTWALHLDGLLHNNEDFFFHFSNKSSDSAESISSSRPHKYLKQARSLIMLSYYSGGQQGNTLGD